MTHIGALTVDAFFPKPERRALAAALNTLLASPTFASWREGTTLDVAEWMAPKQGKPPAVIVSAAHLDDEERALVFGVLLEEILSWVCALPCSQRLRALVVFDEVYGFLPPHPHSPPTKRPLVALMKQARAFGMGVMIATQNPMDLDYACSATRACWCIGRLQKGPDRERVVERLAGNGSSDVGPKELAATIKKLGPRWFLVRDVHAKESTVLLQPRWAMSFMRGPMTRWRSGGRSGHQAQVLEGRVSRPLRASTRQLSMEPSTSAWRSRPSVPFASGNASASNRPWMACGMPGSDRRSWDASGSSAAETIA